MECCDQYIDIFQIHVNFHLIVWNERAKIFVFPSSIWLAMYGVKVRRIGKWAGDVLNASLPSWTTFYAQQSQLYLTDEDTLTCAI